MTEQAYELVDSLGAWRKCLPVLREAPRLAVDLEANSLYAYEEQICLIQISVPGHDYIIDPLADFSISGLGKIFADAEIEKVFHACDYDLMLLKKYYNWRVRNLFDTMWAGRILGFTNMGLAFFLEHLYGIKLSKKYQKANWGLRPLSDAQLCYAQKDTCYLLRMRDELEKQLKEQGHMEEAREIFENETHVHLNERLPVEDQFWSVRGARQLKPRQQAILQALYVFRDEEARRRNTPPFKVFNNALMLLLARHAPRTKKELAELQGVPRKIEMRIGGRLLQAIETGRKAPVPSLPKPQHRHNPQVAERFRTLSEWRKTVAQARGVESDVILSRATMWDLAERNPSNHDELTQIQTLGPCRRARYSDAILELLSTP